MEEARRSPIWGFVDGSISVSGSMLLAVLIHHCQSCNGIWLIGFVKELTDKSAGLIVVATLLLFPTAVAVYGGVHLFFAAKEAVEKREREKGRKEERERIRQAIVQVLEERGILLPDEEIARILDGKPTSPPSRPYRRRSRRGGNGR